jgi:hypothetical protein
MQDLIETTKKLRFNLMQSFLQLNTKPNYEKIKVQIRACQVILNTFKLELAYKNIKPK